MSIVNSRLTRGLYVSSILRPKDVHAFTVVSRMGAVGLSSASAVDYGSLTSKAYYDTNFGLLSLYSLPDASGIQITVDPDFGANYRGFFAPVRGRYEYKKGTTGVIEVIATQNSAVPTQLVITDTTAIEGVHYYYSVLALTGTIDIPIHLGYNPVTGFASAYRYENTDHEGFLFGRLPVEWRSTDDDFTERFVSIFGKLFDSIKTDIDANIFLSKDIDNIEEKRLSDLSSLIDWEINRELTELKQREELKAAVVAYKKKGRDNSIEFLVQLVTGWETEFEAGFRRVLTEPAKGFDPSDAYALANKGLPERTVLATTVGTSTGLASQAFVLIDRYTRAVSVEVEDIVDGSYSDWLEVTTADMATASATDEYYVITEDVSKVATITFGDGVNGAIPISTATIRASYKYGGDVLNYSPEPGKWKNSAGTRVLLTRTPTSEVFDSVLIAKVRKIINRKQASYALYELMIVGTHDEFVPTMSDTHVSDVNTTIAFIKMSTQDHKTNDPGYKVPVKPI